MTKDHDHKAKRSLLMDHHAIFELYMRKTATGYLI
ncbi:hypothetical protein EV207_1645 [Scopulibacillus darangshiensis]|uniref:Uncharacterized protein n=1 Tax=Scopulibacillus darangshiensis TaxID=442528 RepID=A0A4R2NDP1_9BACL|nr:hypothetical protein EV207_1645 [Scopulibacillus darangshiensis]